MIDDEQQGTESDDTSEADEEAPPIEIDESLISVVERDGGSDYDTKDGRG